MKICEEIAFPVSLEKTVWGCTVISFLGLLIDTINKIIGIPKDKVDRALNMINYVLVRKKVTLKDLQQLCGFLNFLCKAIIPGRPFLRRLYTYTETKEGNLKHHHHIWIDKEVRDDLVIWKIFIQSPLIYARPFLDFKEIRPENVNFFTDATANSLLGMGGICGDFWFTQQWDEHWILAENPSIQFLELYAITVGIFNWIPLFRNSTIILYTDNKSCEAMVNKLSANCMFCMKLIRIITLKCLEHNVKVKCEHVSSKENFFVDALSRMCFREFWDKAEEQELHFCDVQTGVPNELWPPWKIWDAMERKGLKGVKTNISQ